MKITFFAAACLASIASAVDLSTLENSMENFTMAETFSEAMAPRDCQWIHQIAVKELPEFYDLVNQSTKYSDPDFGPEESSLLWKDKGEIARQSLQQARGFTWLRASKVFPEETLFGASITPNDVLQGAIGNCWFMSSAAALAEKPGRVEALFLNKENQQRDAGIYGVNLYRLGVPTTVVIDDFLPVKEWNGELITHYARVGDGKGVWGAILEKALAKFHGNYQHLNGGQADMGVRTLTGAPYDEIKHIYGEAAPDSLFVTILAGHEKDSIMQASTPSHARGHDASTDDNIVFGHQYSLLSAHKLSDGTKLVRLRNPWGHKEWTGKYSDGHASWDTIPAKDKKDLTDAKLLVNNKEDGVFFMEFSDFYAKFRSTTITFDVTGWHNAYFLKLNDDGADRDTNAGYLNSFCKGGGCFVHQLIVTSKVDQIIYVTANTTDPARKADECKGPRPKIGHRIMDPSMKHAWQTKVLQASEQVNPIEAKKGEQMIFTVEWDFISAGSDNFGASDWSVTVWGADGEVSIEHSKAGVKSDQWPCIERQGGEVQHCQPPTPTAEDWPAPVDSPVRPSLTYNQLKAMTIQELKEYKSQQYALWKRIANEPSPNGKMKEQYWVEYQKVTNELRRRDKAGTEFIHR